MFNVDIQIYRYMYCKRCKSAKDAKDVPEKDRQRQICELYAKIYVQQKMQHVQNYMYKRYIQIYKRYVRLAICTGKLWNYIKEQLELANSTGN